jgi:hypothetical protein
MRQDFPGVWKAMGQADVWSGSGEGRAKDPDSIFLKHTVKAIEGITASARGVRDAGLRGAIIQAMRDATEALEGQGKWTLPEPLEF